GWKRLSVEMRTPEERHEEIGYALGVAEQGDGAELLYGETDPYAYVLSANAHRRHLTREQKRDLIEKLLKERPERPDPRTAKNAKDSEKKVASVRGDREGRSEIPNVSTRTDTAGRQQPASKPATVVKLPTRTTTGHDVVEQAAEQPHRPRNAPLEFTGE